MSTKPIVVYDIELYVDYFLCMFKDINTGVIQAFEAFDGQVFDGESVREILKASTVIGFNSINFDLPLLSMAMSGADCAKLKAACDSVILNNMRAWSLERKYRFTTINIDDHIDLIDVAPGMASLKIYGGRMHCERMQDLPIEPSASITPEQRVQLRQYCGNDLAVTEMLYRKLLPQIQLREQMGEQYGLELRSKSDAQIAELVIKTQVAAMSSDEDVEIKRPEIPTGTKYRYTAPGYISFTSPLLKEVLEKILSSQFVVSDTGKVNEPEWMKSLSVVIGAGAYTMGIGGLHSTESTIAHHADADTLLIDRDVASYYPNIILSQGLRPAHMGAPFTKVYRSIVERRLAAKKSGDKVTNEALKITINGSFGKFGSKWSVLYSPDLLIATTVTGQLALLMLIERVEALGIPVVSANTDGIVIKCPKSKLDALDQVVFEWETVTQFETEETRYTALYSKDVNNFVAIKPDGSHKAKGVYAPGGLAKTPSNAICIEAVIANLKHGTPVEDTVHGCWDVRKFVTVRAVKGGALDQGGNYLGKAVRFYNASGTVGALTYKTNGYMVPRTEGARPLMDLPADFPADVDLDWYVNEAKSILNDIGATA